MDNEILIQQSDFDAYLQRSETNVDVDFDPSDFSEDTQPVEVELDDIQVPEQGSPMQKLQQIKEVSLGEFASKALKETGKAVTELPFDIPVTAALSLVQDAADIAALLPPTPADWLAAKTLKPEGTTARQVQMESIEGVKSAAESLKPNLDSPVSKFASVLFEYGTAFKAIKTGMFKAASLTPQLAKVAATKGGQVAGYIGASAAADAAVFDAYDERISNALAEVPIPAFKSVFGKLAANPDDPKLLAKAKQVTESVAMSGLVEAFVATTKGVRNYIKASQKANELPYDIKSKIVGMHKTDLPIGDIESRELFLKKNAKAAEGIKDVIDNPKDVIDELTNEINWARLETDDDAFELLSEYAKARRGVVQKSRRGMQSWDTTREAAESLDIVKRLAERRTGEAFNAEELMAARDIYSAGKRAIISLAEQVNKAPTDANAFALNKMAQAFQLIENQFLGARAEAGRALNILRTPVGTPLMRAKQITDVVQQMGGVERSQQLASALLAYSDKGMESFSQALQKGMRASSVEQIMTLRNAGLLTSPKTHIRNVASNASHMALNGFSRTVAGLTTDGITVGESVQYWKGLKDSTSDGVMNMVKAFKGIGVDFTGAGKVDEYVRPAAQLVRRQATGNKVADMLMATQDYIAYGLSVANDKVSRRVFNTLAAPDAFFKTLTFNAEKRALLYREAIGKGFKGDDAAKYVADNLGSASMEIVDQAYEATMAAVFQQDAGKVASVIKGFTNKIPAMKTIIPFVNTPANIFKTAYGKYSPLALMSSQVRQDIAAGGAREAMAWTRMGIGAVTMSATIEAVNNGIITGGGPKDPAVRGQLERAYGWQPYSFDANFGRGDKPKYVSYKGWAEPISMVIGFTADMTEMSSNMPAFDIGYDEDEQGLATSIMFAAANNMLSQTYMSALSEMIEALNDPERRGQAFINRLASSFVPSISGATEMAISPEREYIGGVIDAMKAKIPGLSSTMTKQTDVWGDERSLYDLEAMSPLNRKELGRAEIFLSPFYRSKGGDSPVDKEMLRLGSFPDMPNWKTSFSMLGLPGSADVNMRDYPEAYYRMLQLRGKEIKLPQYGMPMKKLLDATVQGKGPIGAQYRLMNDEGKEKMLRGIISEHTQAAKDIILQEYPDLNSEIREKLRMNPWSDYQVR